MKISSTSPEISIISRAIGSFKENTCNLSSSTCMDILRNKSRTCKVSNQQHIFQKMADPIVFMSPRVPSNCWCADPSLIQHHFPAADEEPSKIVSVSGNPWARWASTRRNANKTGPRHAQRRRRHAKKRNKK